MRCVFVWDALSQACGQHPCSSHMAGVPARPESEGVGRATPPYRGKGVDGKNHIYGGGGEAREYRESDASLPGEGRRWDCTIPSMGEGGKRGSV